MSNTAPDKPTTKLPRLKRYQPPKSLDNKLSDNVAQLGYDLAREREERSEERFGWIFACAFLLDCALFPHSPWYAIPPLLIMQTIMLIVLARRYGVDWAVQLFSWFLHWLAQRKEPANDTKENQGKKS